LPQLLNSIKDSGYENPTEIQKKVIPILNKGIDIIAASKSGTGKTASFVLPMLQKINKMIKPNYRVLRGLIIVPTRELVDQISLTISIYGKYLKIRHTKIQGGISKSSQLEKLNTGIDIIVATPGRLKTFIQEDKIDISSVNTIVLDEVDTMLEMGFIKEIGFLFSNCSKQRQISMFSATISQNIKKLGKEFLYNPVSIEVSNRRDIVHLITHKSFKVDVKKKDLLLAHIIKTKDYQQILVFVNMKEDVDTLIKYLIDIDIKAVAIHGDIKSNIRRKNIKLFRAKKIQVLVATDIAGRGIDIKELPLVVNYELPDTTDDFTHRIGRTGRATYKGTVITLLTVKDYNHFTKIERDLKLSVKREIEDGFEIKDRQPRQRQMVKKSLSEKKSKFDKKSKLQKVTSKSKKTTKRDTNKIFRKK
jgi:ATP-dependent RNA helicase RhlE